MLRAKPSPIDLHKLAVAVRARRGGKTLPIAAEEIGGIDPTMLSRIENERAVPSLDWFVAICEWLELPMDYFKVSRSEGRQS